MKKGIAYIRVSKSRDNMITQDTQLEKIKKYCDLHDIKLVDKYIDLDYSGRSTNRPDFQKLFQDIKTNKINADCLLVYKLDRFARSVNDFHNHMKILDNHSISFISITQQFDTSTPMGRLVRNILVDFAQFESEMVGQRVKDNMIQNAQNGVWNGGPTPLGFSTTEEETGPNLVPDERAEDIIKFYEWYLKPDGSIRSVTIKANEEGIPSSTGGNWNHNQMSRILKNPIYCIANNDSIEYFENQGFEIHNKELADEKNNRAFIRYNRRKPKGATTEIRDEDKWLISVAQHEGIVPADLFIKVQKKLQRNSIQPARAGTGKNALLAWLVKCEKCGKAMSYHFSYSNGKRYNYYRCSAWQQQGKSVCEGNSVRAEELEEAVINKLSKICTGDFIDEAKQELEENLSNSLNDLEQEKEEIENRLKKIKEKKNNIVKNLEMMSSNELVAEVEKKAKKLKKEETELMDQLQDINYQLAEHANIEYSQEILSNKLSNFEETFGAMEFEEKRNFLQSIIRKIEYNEGEATIQLFFAPSNGDHFVVSSHTDIHKEQNYKQILNKHGVLSLTINVDKPTPPEELPEDTFGQRLRKARLLKGWNKKELHEKANVAQTSVTRYEDGRRQPRLSTIKKLASTLDVSMSWLAGYDQLPENTLAQKIKKYRLLKGWTQYDLADKANLDPSTVRKYEIGNAINPPEKTIRKLEEALEKDL